MMTEREIADAAVRAKSNDLGARIASAIEAHEARTGKSLAEQVGGQKTPIERGDSNGLGGFGQHA